MKTIEEIRTTDFVQVEYDANNILRFNRVSLNAWEMIYDSMTANVCGACGSKWLNGCVVKCNLQPEIVSDIYVAKTVRKAMNAQTQSLYVMKK